MAAAKKFNTEKMDQVELSTVEEKCKIETIEDLEICWAKHNENKCKCRIGKGAFGSVYKAKWKGTIDVAVKVKSDDDAQELATLDKANGHPNILKFYKEIEFRSPFHCRYDKHL